MDMKLELVPIPVSDADRAKSFYVEQVGFCENHDQRLNESLRFIQLTPPGSGCSIAFGPGVTKREPGTMEGLLLKVEDAQAACDALRGRGVKIGDPVRMPWGAIHADFADPDGNTWTLQQT